MANSKGKYSQITSFQVSELLRHINIYIYTRRGHKYDTGSCCRIRPFFCPPRVSAVGHKPELQKWKQQGGEIYAESTGRNKGNEMQSEAEGKKSYHHPPPCPSKSMLFFAKWRLAGIQIEYSVTAADPGPMKQSTLISGRGVFIWGWVLSMLSGETCKTDGPVTAAPLTFN